jgi:hypothetical protein
MQVRNRPRHHGTERIRGSVGLGIRSSQERQKLARRPASETGSAGSATTALVGRRCIRGLSLRRRRSGRRAPASRDCLATIAITRSLSTPSPLVERSSHDVEANAAVERCRSRTGPAMRVRASRTHPSLPRRSRKSPQAGPRLRRARSSICLRKTWAGKPARRTHTSGRKQA